MATDEAHKINLVSLIRRTLEKVLVVTGLEETPATVRLVSSCLVHVAANYVRAVGDDPKHIEALFHAFLTGDEPMQKEAIKAYGEAFVEPEQPGVQ